VRNTSILQPRGDLFPVVIGTSVGALAAAFSGWLSPSVTILLFSVLILCFVAIGSVRRPAWLIYFALATAGISSLLRNIESVSIGGATVSLSGLRWIFVAGIALAVLIRRRSGLGIDKAYFCFVAFSTWTLTRWAISPLPVGLRDVLFYSVPVMLGLCTDVVLRGENGGSVPQKIERIVIVTAFIPVIAFFVFLPFGAARFTAIGIEGLIDPRALATSLVVVHCLSLARWRNGSSDQERQNGKLICVLLVIVIGATLSRAAFATALLILPLAWIQEIRIKKLLAATLVGITVASLLFTAVSPLRHRFFPGGDDGVLADEFPYINLEGRGLFWAVTLADTLNQPVIGLGPGSARIIVAGALPEGEDYDEYHPHNDYLQALHDTGIIGLLLLAAGWAYLSRKCWRIWRDSELRGDTASAKWGMASSLGCAVVLLNAVTGNTFHEAYIVSPVLIFASIAAFQFGKGSECQTPA
jgi:O-antigen ligase